MYDHSSDSVLHGTGEENFRCSQMLKAADPGKYTPAVGANYPKRRFGDSLRQLAQLIKANLGVQVAFADIGGWDHHVNEGATEGQLANVLGDFSQSIAAFWTDLGGSRRRHSRRDHVRIRPYRPRKRQSRHRPRPRQRHVRPGRPGEKAAKSTVRWPGLADSQLYEGRDLALTTDFRQVIGEAVARHLGIRIWRLCFRDTTISKANS